MDWHDILIGPDATIQQAMGTIEAGSLRLALVVNAEGELLGVVSDGDIRRGLLRNLSLVTPVREVMNTRPRTVVPGAGRNEILSIMERDDIYSIPVVDAGRVVGLETLHDIRAAPRYDNPVFLMAGGLGSRLRPLTSDIPKPLLKVGGKPILELIVDSFAKSGFRRIYISTHYRADMIRDYFGDGRKWDVDISYVHEDAPLGTAGALGLLPLDEIDKPLFMMNGDLLTALNFQSLWEFHEAHPGIATMCVREYQHAVPFGVIESEGHLINHIEEKPILNLVINAGIYVVSPELVRAVPADTRIDMTDLLREQIKQGKKVNQYHIHEYWLDIGRSEDFERAQVDIDDL
jgi:dTDP-glucose pyrophosphorylase